MLPISKPAEGSVWPNSAPPGELLIAPMMRNVTAVVAAVIDVDGRYCDGNRGFAFLLDRTEPPSLGTRVDHWFLQPRFEELLRGSDPTEVGEVFRGVATLGDINRFSRSINAVVYRRQDRLLLLGEHDIGQLERLNATVLSLNDELERAQRTLLKANRQLERDQAEIRRLMLTDPLTDLANRRSFLDAFAAAAAVQPRPPPNDTASLCLVMADIDHFKMVNDSYGHSVGDRALVVFADCLRGRIRSGDTVARLGGEEFCMLLPACGLAQAMAIAERVRGAFYAAEISGIDRPLSASFGVAARTDGEELERLMCRADRALYQAKNRGRNRVLAAEPHASLGGA
jgi:diguanylate cyclase (GGDEF)-like protein